MIKKYVVLLSKQWQYEKLSFDYYLSHWIVEIMKKLQRNTVKRLNTEQWKTAFPFNIYWKCIEIYEKMCRLLPIMRTSIVNAKCHRLWRSCALSNHSHRWDIIIIRNVERVQFSTLGPFSSQMRWKNRLQANQRDIERHTIAHSYCEITFILPTSYEKFPKLLSTSEVLMSQSQFELYWRGADSSQKAIFTG